MITFILLIVGGLNWLLEAFNWGLSTWGISMGVLRVIYVLVGISALIELFSHKKCCKMCGAGDMGGNMMNK